LTFKELTVTTRRRRECLDITPEIEKVLAESGMKEGFCHVYVPHTTAALVVNEAKDPAVMEDILAHLALLVPEKGNYRHRCKDQNPDSHIQAALLGNQRTLFVREGILWLGTYPRLFFCELDGPRERQVWVGLQPLHLPPPSRDGQRDQKDGRGRKKIKASR